MPTRQQIGQTIDNFDFGLIGGADRPFIGYISSRDKTALSPRALIRGSKNVIKKLSGTIAVRDGLKRRGSADDTDAGVVASFEWTSSAGITYPLRVCNGKLQVESDILASGSPIWYDLITGLAVDQTRFVFDTWWDDTGQHDVLLMVNHSAGIKSWNGGISILGSATPTTITKQDNTKTFAQE